MQNLGDLVDGLGLLERQDRHGAFVHGWYLAFSCSICLSPIGFGLQTSRFSMGNNKKPYPKNARGK